MVKAIPNDDGTLTLCWNQENYDGEYRIYKRVDFNKENWGTQFFRVSGTDTSWTDVNFKEGEAYEYRIYKYKNSIEAIGYVYAGNKKPEISSFGGLILLIDSTYIEPLEEDIALLVKDLEADGWFVKKLYAGRTESPQVVKARIVEYYNSSTPKPRTLFILGHIPVPYSGFFSSSNIPPPDGHVEGQGNHTGAWPADAYYGDVDGLWNDYLVNCTTGGDPRNHNVPGDGKFDETIIPSPVELEVGRVDLYNMPAFGKSDTILMKEYLKRNHLWRTGKWKVKKQALIDNNFQGLNLASTAYHNFSCFVPKENIYDDRDYISSIKQESYLWTYGCGAGGYTSCSGIGKTSDFANDSINNVFTALAGSFFGDWDVQNNFLRAPLCQSALVSFWGGIPKWYIHHMAMGMNIGYGAKITMNNYNFYYTGAFNYSENKIHIALMGDPTLKLDPVEPPSNLEAVDYEDKILLSWNKSPDSEIEGYCIYLVDTIQKNFQKININIIKDTFFVENRYLPSGTYKYAVRAVKLVFNPSGSYYSISPSAFATIDYINNVVVDDVNKGIINLYPNPCNSYVNIRTAKSGKVEVYNIFGEILYRNNIENELRIELSDYPCGLYFIKFVFDDGSCNTQKIIKE